MIKRNKLILFICVVIICIAYSIISKENTTIYYKDYIVGTLKEHNNDFKKSIQYVSDKINTIDIENKEKALNMLARDTYYYMNLDIEKFKENFEDTENILKVNNMNVELVHLYSMISNTYIDEYKYENAYIYINESEKIALEIYNKDKDLETLSTLIAIKYVKADLGMRLKLTTEADKTFKEAEELRNNNNIRERIDIYIRISNYYYQKNDFKNLSKYTTKAIKYLDKFETEKNTNKIEKVYVYDYILCKYMLAESYIQQGKIENAISVLKETEKYNDSINDFLLSKKYKVYSYIYLYYGYTKEAINNLELSYDAIKDSKDIISKIKVVSKIIEISDDTNNENLSKWYKILVRLYKEYENLSDKQFLLNEIIDSDVVESDLRINQLEQKKMYLNTLILIVSLALIIVLFLLRSLYYINRHDNLTKLYNRNYFNTFFDKHKNKQHNLIIFDIDNFKKINDTYGHKFGDLVLESVSNEVINLKYNIKSFRYGGEEFILFIDNYSYEDTIKIAEELRESIYNIKFEENIQVTISLGVCCYGESCTDTLKVADENLYISKKTGKNKVTYS